MSEDNNPNLDLIGMVQRARLAQDAETNPSQVSAVYWIEVKRAGDGVNPTPRAGQWVLATNTDQVDALWATIKQATIAGKLGYKSKVSTSSRDLGTNMNDRIIHVMTYDADDSVDVERVRAALTELGIAGDLTYTRND